MKLTYEEGAELLHKFWSGERYVPQDGPNRCERSSRGPHVRAAGRRDRDEGRALPLRQKPRQIEFSASHIKSMVRDAKERENPVCPQDFEALYVKRIPATRFPEVD